MNFDFYWKVYVYYFDKNGKVKKILLVRYFNQKDFSFMNGVIFIIFIKGSFVGFISLFFFFILVKVVKVQKSIIVLLNLRFDELIGIIVKNL